MKATPTETDREAGRTFVPWPAMRVMWTATSRRWERIADGTAHTGHPFAIDADDDATKGAMLGQLRAAAGQPGLYVVAGDPDLDGVVWWSVPRRFAGRSALSRTEGAALVAAKRALAEAPK